MPTKHEILNWPSWQGFILRGPAIAGSGDITRFQFGNWNPKDKRTDFFVTFIGSQYRYLAPNTANYEYHERKRLFVAQSSSSDTPVKGVYSVCFIFGEYDPQTRKGLCYKIEKKDLLENAVLMTKFFNSELFI